MEELGSCPTGQCIHIIVLQLKSMRRPQPTAQTTSQVMIQPAQGRTFNLLPGNLDIVALLYVPTCIITLFMYDVVIMQCHPSETAL